jgi:hypothetical protein
LALIFILLATNTALGCASFWLHRLMAINANAIALRLLFVAGGINASISLAGFHRARPFVFVHAYS